MNDRIPPEAREAIHAELEADTTEYRDEVPEGEWGTAERPSGLTPS